MSSHTTRSVSRTSKPFSNAAIKPEAQGTPLLGIANQYQNIKDVSSIDNNILKSTALKKKRGKILTIESQFSAQHELMPKASSPHHTQACQTPESKGKGQVGLIAVHLQWPTGCCYSQSGEATSRPAPWVGHHLQMNQAYWRALQTPAHTSNWIWAEHPQWPSGAWCEQPLWSASGTRAAWWSQHGSDSLMPQNQAHWRRFSHTQHRLGRLSCPSQPLHTLHSSISSKQVRAPSLLYSKVWTFTMVVVDKKENQSSRHSCAVPAMPRIFSRDWWNVGSACCKSSEQGMSSTFSFKKFSAYSRPFLGTLKTSTERCW